MASADSLDTAAVRRWASAAVAALEQHRAELDLLNVFPIADSDTGTNLVLTVRAGADALAAADPAGAGQALATLARGAVLAARGNSGVILSQLLRSLADAAAGLERVDAATLRAGLLRGADEAREAVQDPVEGTILTVARAAADAVPAGATLGEVAALALAAAERAVRHTPEQLPELARAGVVDAGGRGLVVVLAALVRALGGDAEAERIATPTVRHEVGEAFVYEVQYLLEADAPAADELRVRLGALGDSVVVVGTGDGVWNVHAHVDDAGAAVEAGVHAGRPYRISVARFADETAERDVAVIAVAPGEGLGRLFEAEGVQVVAGAAPSTADVLAAVRACEARQVVLLPNASRITGVAEAAAGAARASGVRVAVIPTRSPVQGLAAVAVHDAARGFDDDVVAMAEAAAATRFAEVTVATERALTAAGICQEGDLLGLIDGEVVEIGHGVLSVALSLTDRLLAVGAELMTVLVGAGGHTGVGATLARHVRERSPLTEVTVYDVGQPRYPIIIGVE